MKVVYLVMGHYNAEQLGRLVGSVGDSPVLVHIDAKVSIEPFTQACGRFPNVTFITDRVSTKWGGWSVAQATINLLSSVVSDLAAEDYVVLLSGDSYPLQDPAAVSNFFACAGGAQFLNITSMPSAELSKPISRISRLYIEYDTRNGKRNLWPKLVNRLGVPRSYRRALAGRAPYAGSMWWALTGSAVAWMTQEMSRDPKFVTFCRWTSVPDEFFFHTLLGNSPFAGDMRMSVVFADWSSVPASSPGVLDASRVEALAHRGLMVEHRGYGEAAALFARKVVDDEVCKLIRATAWEVSIPILPSPQRRLPPL